jgi:three-Cys-motif partner protein
VEARTLAGPKIVVSTGDANQAHAALKIIAPPGRRYVCAVIDPQSAIFAWEAFEALALDEHAMDVLVLFPDAMDVGRGLSAYLKNGTKLDRYYDPNADWRRVAKESPNPASALRALYERRMRELIGFEVGRPRTVVRAGTKDGALYRLIYGSRSKKGIAIWDDIARRSRDEQIEMYLPDV